MGKKKRKNSEKIKITDDTNITSEMNNENKIIQPSLFVYLFFLIHMAGFGGSGFYMAYSDDGPPLFFLLIHGGFAIFVYTKFYIKSFGYDEVKWMFINAALSALGIYTQIDWILSYFNKTVDDFSLFRHIIPFLYFVLYTFLLRQAFIDFTFSRNNPFRQKLVEYTYIVNSIFVYFYFS